MKKSEEKCVPVRVAEIRTCLAGEFRVYFQRKGASLEFIFQGKEKFRVYFSREKD